MTAQNQQILVENEKHNDKIEELQKRNSHLTQRNVQLVEENTKHKGALQATRQHNSTGTITQQVENNENARDHIIRGFGLNPKIPDYRDENNPKK